MEFIRIINETGLNRDTKILMPDGQLIPGVKKVSLMIEAGEPAIVTATIQLYAKIDIKAKQNE